MALVVAHIAAEGSGKAGCLFGTGRKWKDRKALAYRACKGRHSFDSPRALSGFACDLVALHFWHRRSFMRMQRFAYVPHDANDRISFVGR